METTNKTKWAIDPAHSEIAFKVKHLMITNVKGEFKSFTAEAYSEGDKFLPDSIQAVISASSIFTNNEDRDAHLKSPDFFDAEHFEQLTFKGTSIKQVDDENYQLVGLLSIKGIEKEVAFDVEFGGINKDPWGNEKAGFSMSTKINRKEWGLTWNAALETGGVLVSDDVRISADLQFVKQSLN
jgi:polyisoprenoid-binding protein YceI